MKINHARLILAALLLLAAASAGMGKEPLAPDLFATADRCMACHNVHGSQVSTMVRTGELIGQQPGLNLKYLDNGVGEPWSFVDPQTPVGSTGGAMDLPAVGSISKIEDNGVCYMCHDQREDYYRSYNSSP